MANKTIVMSKLRRLLQLHSQGKSKLFISKYLELSRNTVDKYVLQYKLLDLPLEEIDKLTGELMTERNLLQGEPKVIAGVEEKVEVIPEYSLV